MRKRETELKRLVIVEDFDAVGDSEIHLLCFFLFCNIIWDSHDICANIVLVLEH